MPDPQDAAMRETEGLVERLRSEEPSGRYTVGSGGISCDGKISHCVPSVPIMRLRNPDGPAAAVLIEAQSAEIARLKDAVAARVGQAEEEEHDAEVFRAAWKESESALAAAQDRVARLSKAIEPFARIANHCAGEPDETVLYTHQCLMGDIPLTIGQFRHAAEALAGTAPQGRE